MASLQFSQLIQRTRELVNIFGNTNLMFRDGLPADAGSTNLVPIGAAVNDIIQLCASFGCNVGDKTLTAVATTQSYPLTLDVLTVISAKYPLELTETTRQAKRSKGTGALTRTGTPSEYFLEGNNICLVPIPDAACILANGTGLIVHCTLSIAPLVAGTDPVLYIPETMQWLIPYASAFIIANIDADNPAQVKRLDLLGMYGQRLLDFMFDRYATPGMTPIKLVDIRSSSPLDSIIGNRTQQQQKG